MKKQTKETYTPYQDITPEQTILRDRLALDRTLLATERTLLAYIRTFLAFLVTGAGLIKFFTTLFLQLAGWVFISSGIICLFIGLWRFNSLQKEHRHKRLRSN